MALRRGFKAEAERVAESVRQELGLSADQQVQPRQIAEHLGIEVFDADQLVARARLEELEQIQAGAFSACTFRPSPTRTVIVVNPLHSPARQSSDLAHELAHLLLDHELSRLQQMDGMSFLACDASQEEEADWLCGCLLLPRALLLKLVRQHYTPAKIAEELNISKQMATWRINVTGVRRQAGP
jgi:Zn-dependent peptidase ImmA (M78 family)